MDPKCRVTYSKRRIGVRKIVLSAIAITVLTVGMRWGALAVGASEPTTLALITLILVVLTLTLVTAVILGIVETLGIVAFVAVIALVLNAGMAIFVFLVAVIALILAILTAVAKKEGLRFRWMFTTYALAAFVIGGELAVGSVRWSVVIALTGIIAFFILWRFVPERHAPSDSVTSEGDRA